MWVLYILLALMTAAITLFLVRPPLDHKFAAVLTGVIPALALFLYLMLGRPDLPAAPHAATEDLAPRHAMLLMQRPLDILEKKDAENLGALAAMGELSVQLRQYKKAEAFYERAIRAAQKEGDPRETLYKKKLAEVKGLAAHVGQP